MLKLVAQYNQNPNGTWDAFITDNQNIYVSRAEDLETARVILRIITAEEISQMSRVRANWDITREEINYFNKGGNYG